MRDAMAEYKIAVKKVDPNFDGNYIDSLILGEPQTHALEDLIGFDHLDPIGTPRVTAEPNVGAFAKLPEDAIAQPPASTLADQLALQTTEHATDQSSIPPTANQ